VFDKDFYKQLKLILSDKDLLAKSILNLKQKFPTTHMSHTTVALDSGTIK
jgi:hypothetical protein